MRYGPAVLLLLAVLTLPTAVAESAQGSLRAAGLDMRAQGELQFTPLATFLPGDGAWQHADLSASKIHVTIYEYRQLEVGEIRTMVENRTRSYELHDAVVKVTKREAGWIGFYPSASKWELDVAGSATVFGAPRAWIGNTNQPGVGSASAQYPIFGVDVAGSHLSVASGGAAVAAGEVVLKSFGTRVEISAAENSSVVETGEFGDPRPLAGDQVIRWIVIVADDSRVGLDALAGAQIATQLIEGNLTGTFASIGGMVSVQTPTSTYELGRAEESFAGSLHFVIQPYQEEVLAGTFTGELTRAGAAIPVSGKSRVPYAVGLLVVAAVAMAGLWASRRRGERDEEFNSEQCAQLASAAADEGDMARALDWTRRAISLAPGSARLRADEGFYLQELGELSEALASYRLASTLSSDGEAAFLEGVLLATRLHDETAAEEAFIRAFQRTPSLALEARDDPALTPILKRPNVRSAVRRALRQLDDEGASSA